MPKPIDVVILAAGQGTRMKSDLPKVLHRIGGEPMLAHVYRAARALSPRSVQVVYGHGGKQVTSALEDLDVQWVEQAEQLGTGHAVAQALPAIADAGQVIILYADVPLVRAETLRRLVEVAEGGALALLTVRLSDPTGYGRILRDEAGEVVGIVEQKDATEAQQRITEVNSGLLCVDGARLRQWVSRLDNRNAQGEFYLTDIFAMAVTDGVAIRTVLVDAEEVQGVNDRGQLAVAEREYQRRQANELMRAGLTLLDPARFDLRGRLTVGKDCLIDVNVVIEGDVRLGDRVQIGPHCVLRNTTVGDETRIKEMSVIEDATIGARCLIGPFARLRPGAQLAEGAHVGNFVEIKNSNVGRGSKINHLSYVGDSDIGAEVNIGAGTITCNYDGANKHRTVIGDRAFVGSDSALVAPVTIGADATIGAGSTITRDAPAGELTLSRSAQRTVPGWQRPKKEPRS